MNITVDVDSGDLQRAFRAAPDKTVKAIERWVAYTSGITERVEKKQVPVRTGVLQSSVHQVINGVRATIKPNVSYAVFVHEGARGRKPNRFADRTYAEVQPVANRKADEIIGNLVRSI